MPPFPPTKSTPPPPSSPSTPPTTNATRNGPPTAPARPTLPPAIPAPLPASPGRRWETAIPPSIPPPSPTLPPSLPPFLPPSLPTATSTPDVPLPTLLTSPPTGEETWSPTKDSSTNVGASTEPPPGIGVRPLRNTPPAWASTGPRHGSGWEPVGEVWLPRRRRRGTRQTTLGGVLRSFRRTRPTDRGTRCQGRRGTRIGARGTRKAPFAAFLCTSRRARTGNWGGWHWDG
mmetsp:Transcript_21205/g.42218  ORF Transcript_21205/g.42218 Transcript_21205/m.42218 type:complete len:231 (+) Transcript_21205:300-992(+)